MSSESMRDRLDDFYREHGLLANDFRCEHLNACKSVCKPDEMVSLPASYVGPEYEVGTLPRLLFVSSDPNDAKWVKEQPAGWGSLKDIREDRLQHHKRGDSPSSHWERTLNLAGALFAHFDTERLGRIIDPYKIVEYIAHTKSTRCKDCTIGSKEGHPLMPLNCREFLPGEVIAMQPDIIVTQGARARNSLAGAFPFSGRVSMQGYPNTFYQIVQLEPNHAAIMIVAEHPCAHFAWKRGEWNQFMDWAAKCVQEFIPVFQQV